MANPLLCVTVAASSMDEMRNRRDEASDVADIVELRLDALSRPDGVEAALAGRRRPVIVTCRPRWEGGGYDGPEESRLRLLHAAADMGAEYVDLEWRADDNAFVRARQGRGIVLSLHDFEGIPDDLRGLFDAMRATGAEVLKLAVTPRSLSDCLKLLELARAAAQTQTRAVLIAMGPSGVVTRILPERFGSCWSYAADGVAPGQIPVERLVAEFRFRETGPQTSVYGVAGQPVLGSFSPAMHNAAFRLLGLDAVYLPLETSDADDLLRFAAGFGLAGASVTIPLKVALFERVGASDPLGGQLGAVNTVRWRDGRCEGINTDLAGFLAPLAAEPLEGARAAVLGSGGAARAVAAGLRARGAAVAIYGRALDKAAAVAARVGGEARTGLPSKGSWDILVNATPVGSAADLRGCLLDVEDLAGGRLVYDLVYNPIRTLLLQRAAAAGCRTIGGLDMLAAQAAAQFEWWTGREAPVERMREAATARLRAVAGAA
jgi:3-dehydroquinate dehydratase/shikimate dehydrogenase